MKGVSSNTGFYYYCPSAGEAFFFSLKNIRKAFFLVFFSGIIAHSIAQCPTITQRTSGNGGAASCPGVGSTTYASNFQSGVSTYAYNNYGPPRISGLSKTGDLTQQFSSALTIVPAIKRVWFGGVLTASVFGPPSVP